MDKKTDELKMTEKNFEENMLAYKNNEEKRIFLKQEYKNMILNIETFCLSI